MIVQKAHKIRLNPTPEQEQYFWRAAGVARYAYNWGVAEYNRRLDHNREIEDAAKRLPASGRILRKEFNRIKPDWVGEVTSWAYQGAFNDLQRAFRGYFDKKRNGTLHVPRGAKPRKDDRPHGWPNFKARNRTTPAFYLANTALKFDGHEFRFDKKRAGWVDMTEPLRFNGKVLGGRISHRGGYWWLSVQVEMKIDDLEPPGKGAVGIDLGIKHLAVSCDTEGTVKHWANPAPLRKALRKLARLQRKLDRQRRANNPDNYNPDGTAKEGPLEWLWSANVQKTQKKLARLHYRITCIRQDAAHKMTSEVAREYAIVGVEDLDIRGMLASGKASRELSDAALYEKRRQLEYKAPWNGGQTIVIERGFPTNRKCNRCEHVSDSAVRDRWTCPNCGAENDRYANSAANIRDEALKLAGGK